MIQFSCACGTEIRVPESLGGMEGACSACARRTRVPGGALGRTIVDLAKEPVLPLPGMGGDPEVQGRTLIPGLVYAFVLIGLVGAILHEREGFFEVLGRSDGWSIPAALGWGIVTFLAVQTCIARVATVYHGFTGKAYKEDLRGFAEAGGYDVARWAPLVALVAVFAAYALTRGGSAEDRISFVRNPWLFTLIGAALSHALAAVAARAVFRARIGGTGATDAMLEALRTTTGPERIAVAARLAKSGDRRAVQPLIELLDDADEQVRWAAAKALGNLGDVRASAPLAVAAEDPKVSVRWEAQKARAKIEKASRRSRRTRREPAPARSTTSWENVYVFISSTFNDMHGERDYLVKQVFPQLRDWCERRRLRLVDVDLRWGVTEQDATHNKNVVKVCLERIDQCRPFFLCLLGQRRGWVPKPSDVSAETHESFPELAGALGNASVTELEILHALLRPLGGEAWRDSTARLGSAEPAKHSFFYLRDPSYLEDLPGDPPQARWIYTNESASDPAERAAHDAAVRSWREEIIPESGRPVRSYRARWDPGASTPELAVPLECPSAAPANVARWHAEWAAAGVTTADGRVGAGQEERARAFNGRLSKGRLTEFSSAGRPLSEVILEDLRGAIEERFPDHRETAVADDLELEIDQQERFLFLNTEEFVSRPGDFDELDEYVDGSSTQLFVLTGSPGAGKSMLLGEWIEHRRADRADPESPPIHFRFVGASDNSTTVDALLRSTLHELRETGAFDEEIPHDPLSLRNALLDLLYTAGQRARKVIVIDGLNQLETGLDDLGWLPTELPHNVKLIVSFARGSPDAEELFERCRADDRVWLATVRPFGDLDDRRLLARLYLSHYLKELDDRQLEAIIGVEAAGNPLYLRVVLSELRVFGAFANLQEQLRREFGSTVLSAFDRVLRRLETDPAYSGLDPRVAVPLIFGLLAHARRGLSLDELTDLVVSAYPWPSGDGGQSREDRARDAVNLYLRQLRPFLSRRDGRVDFFYESLKNAAAERYVSDGSLLVPGARPPEEWHGLIAAYFEEQPLYLEERPNLRKLDEQPWQQALAAAPELEHTLCDLEFVEAKCSAGMTAGLVQDYSTALEAWPDGPARDRISLFSRFVSAHAHIFARDGTQVLPFAYNYAANGPVVANAEHLLAARGWRSGPWVQLLDRPPLLSTPALLRTLEGHRSDVTGVAMTPDARLTVSGSKDGTIRIWETNTGVLVRTCRVPGAGGVNDVAVTPDGRRAASAGADGIVRIWDVRSGACEHSLSDHDGEVATVALTADGRCVSGGEDAVVRIWDLEQPYSPPARLPGHFGRVNSVAVMPTGPFAVSGGWDATVRLWDIDHAARVDCFSGHAVSVQGIGIGESRGVIASSSGSIAGPTGTAPPGIHDSDVRFWDLSGRCLFRGTEHEIYARGGLAMGVLGSAVNDIAVTPDARIAVSGGYDRMVCVWKNEDDSGLWRAVRKFAGHRAQALSVAINGSGTLAATGGADDSVRIWELAGESPVSRPPSLRIGAIGRSARVSPGDRARLAWRNRRLQRWFIGPLVAAAVAAVPAWVLEENVIQSPLGFWPDLTGAVGFAAYFAGGLAVIEYVRWRRTMAADPTVQKTALLPKAVAGALGWLLLPLTASLRVVDCPVCGHRVCGRRRLFHCSHCEWRDGYDSKKGGRFT